MSEEVLVMANLEIICGDITTLHVNGLVLPAHKHYTRSRGLSAQVFDIAGPELVAACSLLGKSHTSDTRITPAPNLSAQYIIHTVTPLWSSGDFGGTSSLELLEQCYKNSIQLALEQGIKHIAFPALGTGTNKTPHSIAAHIGLTTIFEHKDFFKKITICLHSEFARSTWQDCYDTHLKNHNIAQAC
mgnify:FL=1